MFRGRWEFRSLRVSERPMLIDAFPPHHAWERVLSLLNGTCAEWPHQSNLCVLRHATSNLRSLTCTVSVSPMSPPQLRRPLCHRIRCRLFIRTRRRSTYFPPCAPVPLKPPADQLVQMSCDHPCLLMFSQNSGFQGATVLGSPSRSSQLFSQSAFPLIQYDPMYVSTV